jgi:hypothetical protein
MPNVSPRAEPAWKTKDGRTIPISTLTDAHLANIIRVLENAGVLEYERYLMLKKQARWTAQQGGLVENGGLTDEQLIIEVEGKMLEGALQGSSVRDYHVLCKERARRKRKEERIENPYGFVEEDKAV